MESQPKTILELQLHSVPVVVPRNAVVCDRLWFIMRKHWVMLAVFLAAGMMACQSNQDTRPNPEPAKQKQPAFHPTNREQGQAEAGNDKAKPDGISQRRDASFKWPEWMGDSNWWVVIIAALTGSVIGLQG
jgi:hypothetical protein